MAMENVMQEAIKDKRTVEVVAGGSLAEGVAGSGAVVLSIVGLAGVMAPFMVAIATILAGLALVLEGGALGVRFPSLARETAHGRLGVMELGGGMSAEVLGGIGGIVLGILALLGVHPMTLVPIAAIAFGGTLLLGAGATARLNDLQIERACDEKETRHVARAAVRSAEGMQVLAGVGSGVLGILALTGYDPMILGLVAMLSVGISDLMSGTAISGRMLSALHCS